MNATNNTCDLITVSNCLVVEAANSCTTCRDGYLRTASTSTTTTTYSCVDKTLSNCAQHDITESTRVCKLCNPGYYLHTDGTCKTTSSVTNCEEYSAIDLCSRCKQGYALSTDKKSCTDAGAQYAQCVDTKVAANFECSICKGGAGFVNNTCQNNSSAKLENGCFDEDENGKCYFCISGYTMTDSGTCTVNTVVNPPSNNDSGTSILGFFSAIMLFLLF